MNSLMEILEHSFHLYPNKSYLFDGKTTYTYKQLYHEVNLLAASLSKLGVRKGDRILTCLPNWHEFVTVFFGLAKIGAIIIPCNPCYRAEDLQPILENGEIKAVFMAEKQNQKELFQSKDIPLLITVRFKEKDCYSFDELLRYGENLENPPFVPIDADNDVMAILYSSGTTGTPKGVMLTHKNLFYTANTARIMLDCSNSDIIFAPVPVFHVFGLVPGVIQTILTGAEIIFMEKFKAEKALQLIENGRVTIHLGVPTMFILELSHLDKCKYDLSSLRTGIIAGSPCPSEVVRKIRNTMGCHIKISYGLTETASAVTFTSFADDEFVCSETVGKTVSGTEIKIVDDNRKEVSAGEIGELACRGTGVMKGYYQMPWKTEEVLDQDGWYYTGDLAKVFDNGYVTIVGRKKDMIIRGGYKIYPHEVEEILFKHPSVLDAIIIGIPNPVLGENSCACIKLKPNHYETEETLKNYLANRVVKYKVPDRILYVDEFPLTPSGKIKKDKLIEMLLSEKTVTV